jgi:hypothetical protein
MTNTGLGRRTELMIFFGSCRRFELEGKLLAYIVSFFILSFCSGKSVTNSVVFNASKLPDSSNYRKSL